MKKEDIPLIVWIVAGIASFVVSGIRLLFMRYRAKVQLAKAAKELERIEHEQNDKKI